MGARPGTGRRAVEVQVVGQVAAAEDAAESLEAVARLLMERAAELRREA